VVLQLLAVVVLVEAVAQAHNPLLQLVLAVVLL
jgi:hypothetical protein